MGKASFIDSIGVNALSYYKKLVTKNEYDFSLEEYTYKQRLYLYELRSRFNPTNSLIMNTNKRGVTPSEKSVQATIIDYLKYFENRIWLKTKIHGSTYFGAGYPDIWINLPNKSYNGLFFELKTTHGKVTLLQEKVHKNLRLLGYNVHVIRSFNEFLILFGYYIGKTLTCIDTKYHTDIHIATLFNSKPKRPYSKK